MEKYRAMIIEKLEQIKDPEFDYNIVELGLVYKILIQRKDAKVILTLTTPFCPYGDSIISEVQSKLSEIEELEYIEVEIVFDPEWNLTFIEENPKEKLLKTGVFKG